MNIDKNILIKYINIDLFVIFTCVQNNKKYLIYQMYITIKKNYLSVVCLNKEIQSVKKIVST